MTERKALKRRKPEGRERTPGKVRLGRLRVTPRCARVIRRYADKQGMYQTDAIAKVLEGWAKRVERKRQRVERQRKG